MLGFDLNPALKPILEESMELKKPITLDELQAYWKQYEVVLKEKQTRENIGELFVNIFLGLRLPIGPNLAIVAIQMHIFEVPAFQVESDFKDLRAFFKMLDEKELQKICESMMPEMCTDCEAAVAFVNSFVELWNRNVSSQTQSTQESVTSHKRPVGDLMGFPGGTGINKF